MLEELKPQEKELAGEEKPQPKELGAEEKPQEEKPKEVPKPKRTYTEDEWAKRESEKDKEAAALRQALAQINMQGQISEAERLEKEASKKDKESVEQGLITAEDAKEREQVRKERAQLYFATLKLKGEQEDIAKTKVAQTIAQKYGISAEELLSDKEVKSPVDMVEKAASLAQKKLTERLETLEGELKAFKEGEQKFDRGQQGGMTQEKSLKSRYPSMYKNK